MKIVDENIQSIIQEYQEGVSMDKLGKKYGCNSGTIYYALKKFGVETRPKKLFEGEIQDYYSEIKRLYETGNSCKKISKTLGISEPTISRALKELGFELVSDVDYNNLLRDKLPKIIEMFDSGINIDQISKLVGHSNASVWTLLSKNGIKTSKYKIKHHFDESYFEEINTPNKAYILGWFYSDGNVMDVGKCRISILQIDEQILFDIAKEIKYLGPLPLTKPTKNKPSIMRTLGLDRVKVAKDLMRLGVVPKKSLILKFPTEEIVPNNLLSHFVRGYYDGDGSLSPKGLPNITSTDIFCNELSSRLKDIGIYNTRFYYRKPNKPTGTMWITFKEEANAFLKWIYLNAEMKLERKYQQYLDLMQ